MDSESRDLEARQSILLIEHMISIARNRLSENGHLYLLWGWVVFFCAIGQYILSQLVHYEWHYMIWLLTWVAFIYQVFYIRKKRRRQGIRTYSDEIIAAVWIAFVICMFLCSWSLTHFAMKGDSIYYQYMGPVFLAIYGVPTFLSGNILRFKPLIYGGISCWVLSLAAGFVPSTYQLLMLAAAVFMAWIIPGYLLRSRYKKQNA